MVRDVAGRVIGVSHRYCTPLGGFDSVALQVLSL